MYTKILFFPSCFNRAFKYSVTVTELVKKALKTSNSNWFTQSGEAFKDAVHIDRTTQENPTPVDASFLSKKLEASSTFSVNAAGLVFPQVAKLCLHVMSAFGLPANANLYATYKESEVSVPPHNDPQDLLILQMQGEKWWTLYEPDVPWPSTSQCKGRASEGSTIPVSELQEPIGPVHLTPGDLLYVPFGMVHRTSTSGHERTLCKEPESGVLTSGCTSLHLAMGIHMESYGHVYGKLLECALLGGKRLKMDDKLNAVDIVNPSMEKEISLREPLPLGFPARSSSPGMWRHLKKRIVEAFSKYAIDLDRGDLEEHVEDGATRTEAVIAHKHEELVGNFRSAYEKASAASEEDEVTGYEWLNDIMGQYQRDTMRLCSPELSPAFEY